MALTDDQLDRYARHLVLREVGGMGQQKLLQSKVLVIGAGGLGSPLILYLAAAGVGTIGVVDDDVVDLSNLQRQIAHGNADIGTPKVVSAEQSVARINPDVKIVPHNERLTEDNAEKLFADYDLIADGSDNFGTRFLINDTCYRMKKTLVSAAMLQFEGQLSTYKAYLGGDHPCYRCIFPAPPPADVARTCGEAGVLGALAGTMGSLQATEILKELLEVGDSMSGQLLIYDALYTDFRKVKVRPDPKCSLCGNPD
ncbi:molybdopterin-synthase adenylyltransferase MoeB [Sneathiella sp. P13V-1]|uniref:HesA/MoeB/ThiF family protein n=1 Tax=Sneathiella sp. P13V-1 TaxID=2697366 RepID=UPI00187BBD80|nr:molybdopterin-synthase adenylyltransferase MoeB [Sneathiella sp. P13V-1]MBE7636024.1 molybdopterin-synthase adenylyltransferase MoeB [Sneathiella sp. P13V-1]